YVWRLRIITDKFLSWRKSFQVIALWEFASTLTPGIVGGAAVALFYLTKEKIALGKSTAIVLLTGFLDEVIFIVTLPILLLILKQQVFVSAQVCNEASELPILNYVDNIALGTIVIYLILLVFTILIGYGLFVNPRAVKMLFVIIARLKFMKKWKDAIIQSGDDVIYASKEFRSKPTIFWIRAYASTAVSWIARFSLANVLVIAFGYADVSQLLVYGRQFVIWMMMLIPTTPGGTGIAEISFIAFMCEFFPDGTAGTVTFFWRFISYYFFMMLGVLILPRWISRVYPRKPKDQ
ncbi:MAG: flippase-like domain-containing protein, partial [Chitinophagales bacterium]|nr:flippase-like domain-containing protein [Chitinophagales bacterium]